MTKADLAPKVGPLRTWIIDGEPQMMVSVYQPVVTIRCGDAPEVKINPNQVTKLCNYFTDLENFFETGESDELRS